MWSAYLSLNVKPIICIIGYVGMIYKYLTKGYLFQGKDVGKELRPIYLKYRKIIERSLIIIITAFMVFVSPAIISSVLDIPYLISGEFETVEGYTISQSIGGQKDNLGEREIVIVDMYSGEKIKILCVSTGIYKNEYIKAYYLPNSGIAQIVERSK